MFIGQKPFFKSAAITGLALSALACASANQPRPSVSNQHATQFEIIGDRTAKILHILSSSIEHNVANSDTTHEGAGVWINYAVEKIDHSGKSKGNRPLDNVHCARMVSLTIVTVTGVKTLDRAEIKSILEIPPNKIQHCVDN